MMPARGTESTPAFRAKALYLCVRSLKGREGASAFVRSVDAGRIFDDETKPISRELWLRALLEFERAVGDMGFRRLSRYLVHPKNLGVWSSLLRGARSPHDIYAKLDESHGDPIGGWTWRVLQQTSRSWSGEICFLESDEPEDRARIRKALSAELKSIPLLFGLAPATVTSRVEPRNNSAGESDDQVVQTATYRSAVSPPLLAGLIASPFLVGAAYALAAAAGMPLLERLIALGVAALLTGVTTFLVSRDAHFRALRRAQQLRILALEREGLLQRKRVKEISRPHEEPIIAGKYRLAEQLGAGAAGSVWKARRLTDGVSVAVKLLRTALAQDPRATDRLRREAQALGLAWHPNVVEALDDGLLSSGVAFLVTELLTGETLARRLTRGALPEEEVIALALQATDALMAIHSAGIVHRDIKPENLFLHRATGFSEVLKLIDFGVASVTWAETRLTRHGARVGTQGYAAPEQERGDEVDARADLYSLGVCLREALTCELPGKELPLSLERIPESLRSILTRLLAPDREDRYETAKELKADLIGLSRDSGELVVQKGA